MYAAAQQRRLHTTDWLQKRNHSPLQIMGLGAEQQQARSSNVSAAWDAVVSEGFAFAQLHVEAFGMSPFGNESARLVLQPLDGHGNDTLLLDPYLVSARLSSTISASSLAGQDLAA